MRGGGWTEGVRCVATTLAVGSDKPVTPGQARVCGYDESVPAKVLLAAPRGYCAAWNAPSRRSSRPADPAHRSMCASRSSTTCVVRDLEAKGAVFVDEETEVPEGGVVVLSAHGVAPEVYANAERRSLGARRDVSARHEGASGGETVRRSRQHDRPDRSRRARGGRRNDRAGAGADDPRPGPPGGPRARDPGRRRALLPHRPRSVDETNEIVAVLRERFPRIQGPPREDICYATQNRQDAIKEVARRSDVVLVIGSDNSSNSNRLAEVARELGTPAYLVDDETEVDPAWIDGAGVVGVTSGVGARAARRRDARLARGAGERDRGRGAAPHRGAAALLGRPRLARVPASSTPRTGPGRPPVRARGRPRASASRRSPRATGGRPRSPGPPAPTRTAPRR